jgi:hypothetical protein
MWQKLRRYALTGIDDPDLDVVVRRLKTSTRPPAGVNLIAFTSRFHNTC